VRREAVAILLAALLVALPRVTSAQEYTWTPPMLAAREHVSVSYTLKVVDMPAPPAPPAPPPEEGRPVRDEEEAPPIGYVFIPPWVYEPLLRWWWLLLLLLLALLLLYYYRRRRGSGGVEVVVAV